jgi:methylated-DNA-[protein]-cysteine S-methyltransferase
MTMQPLHLERMSTPIGPMLIVTDDQDALRAVGWDDDPARMHRDLHLPDGVRLVEGRPLSEARRALEAYFAGELHAIDGIPVQAGGTAFQRDVWAALRTIPVGQTMSYGALAAQIGRPRAVRAVGLANGANPIGVVVPCHRVIGADASLTGYGGGIERKRWLLEHEGARFRESHLVRQRDVQAQVIPGLY